MADVDEDVIPRGASHEEDVDLSDETQDFRFLLAFSSDDAKIPKRGEKDFEPHHTNLQASVLEQSRAAMHTALSYQRSHAPKRYNVAHYHPETNMAYTVDPKGPLFKNMGRVYPSNRDPLGHRDGHSNRLWLLPEEILYLLERGTIDVRWPPSADDNEELGVPMSLQGAYAAFIGREDETGGALTFERYSVYAGLKRMGYVVHRAPSWNSSGDVPGEDCLPPSPSASMWSLGLLAGGLRNLFMSSTSSSEERQKQGPLVKPGCYRSYADIYRRLALVPGYDPSARKPEPSPPTDPAFRITYHLWKPGSTTYKKSDPGQPDFRIAVVNARETCVPTLAQLGALLDSTPYRPPQESGQMYQKFRNGYKNVILAVVDQGVTSYLRIADAGFGKEKLYERKIAGPNQKKGGARGKPRGGAKGK
ncbi:hypothetical protein AAFC00_001909 [Neodothiora populina]|uniref:tRNA-splicing endonuclease subunit Sen54 N-terminal domain-containing protein n=1 Tax=Neodothiora populina TaxID=2781224 RepID=A0ABR3PQK8_9PEZI